MSNMQSVVIVGLGEGQGNAFSNHRGYANSRKTRLTNIFNVHL